MIESTGGGERRRSERCGIEEEHRESLRLSALVPAQQPQAGEVQHITLPTGSAGRLAGSLLGHLLCLPREEVYFNEAAFGLLAFYLSKRWPCAVLLCRGDLWHHSTLCLSGPGDAAVLAGSAQPAAPCAAGLGAAQRDLLQ